MIGLVEAIGGSMNIFTIFICSGISRRGRIDSSSSHHSDHFTHTALHAWRQDGVIIVGSCR